MNLRLPSNSPLDVPFFLTPPSARSSLSDVTRTALNSLSPIRLPSAGDSENFDWNPNAVSTAFAEVFVIVRSNSNTSPPISPG
jgi:hypothetical protein